ncbi:Alkaline phosphatase synthesis sensor protein PhoR [Arcobacter porcinus]|uniref:HAMP domain-containing sensor histidine kinase n=1 Tax=Arcobacter porcinus TaxID=1935204 RepID=UPI0008270949|nr:ATP-binding protein [Arcobacter porcinus]OCL84190.1 Alkaline phosphatase synthesis sensor protein PhoR [Arcobacter porcinus]
MLKIHQLFLRTYLVTFFAIFATLSIVIYFWAKSFYVNEIEKNLIQNIKVLSILMEKSKDIDSVLDLVNNLSSKLEVRVSIIDKDGNVIAESHKKVEEIKENHLNRIEIIQAINFEIGKQTRVSQTLSKEYLYVAKKVYINNEMYILRIADDTSKIIDNFIQLSIEIFIYMALFLTISFMISYFISLRIKKEIDSILDFLENLGNAKDNEPFQSNFTYEFNRITKILNKVSSKLQVKAKEKAKYTAKLKFANRQKDDIISAISHEFKNPIAVIKGYSQTLINDPELPNDMRNKFLNKIIFNSDKLSKIIDKLRLSIKLRDKDSSLDIREFYIRNILENILGDLKVKYKDRKILLKGENVKVKADETLFTIVISNLMENALKYSFEDVIVEFDENSISIIDKGVGIDVSELEKVKKKYYRVSHNNWNNSLGLGLYIVQTIVSLHGFTLDIESKKMEGSKFTIRYY